MLLFRLTLIQINGELPGYRKKISLFCSPNPLIDDTLTQLWQRGRLRGYFPLFFSALKDAPEKLKHLEIENGSLPSPRPNIDVNINNQVLRFLLVYLSHVSRPPRNPFFPKLILFLLFCWDTCPCWILINLFSHLKRRNFQMFRRKRET